MNIVGHYRQAIDQLLAAQGGRKSSSGTVTLGFEPNPDKTFNRGYTSYFFCGRGAEVASPDSPKHVGEPLGRVAALGRDSFTLDAPAPLQSGDGITFYDREQKLEGSTVNRVQGKTVFPQKLDGLATGARVFRNHDHAFARQIAQSRPVRKIAVALKLGGTAEGIFLEATDEDGVHAVAALACDKIPAEKPDRATANTEQQLAKLGDTEFVASSIAMEWATPLHLPPAQVNSLRRQLVDKPCRRACAGPPHARKDSSSPTMCPSPTPSFPTSPTCSTRKPPPSIAATGKRHRARGRERPRPRRPHRDDHALLPQSTSLGLCPRERTRRSERTEPRTARAMVPGRRRGAPLAPALPLRRAPLRDGSRLQA